MHVMIIKIHSIKKILNRIDLNNKNSFKWYKRETEHYFINIFKKIHDQLTEQATADAFLGRDNGWTGSQFQRIQDTNLVLEWMWRGSQEREEKNKSFKQKNIIILIINILF